MEPPPINPRGRLSPSRQIAAWLRTQISDGAYGPDDALPSEKQLQDIFGVARETARRAVRVLVDEGLVETEPGRGTYVRQQQGK